MGLGEENNFGLWYLVAAGAVLILIKFNNYNCNLWPLRALKIYNCKIFLR